MRLAIGLLLAVAAFAIPAIAQDTGDCPFSKPIRNTRCCVHMCPAAREATTAGYEVVAQVPVAVVAIAELEG